MKKLIISLLILCAFLNSSAQLKEYKVVFDITGKDTIDHLAVIRQVTGILESNPDARLEVVVYGQGLGMVLNNESVVGKQIRQLTSDHKASFKVCAATMKRHNVQKEQLVPGVEVVPDGIYEIVSRQAEGWGYIKVGH